MNTENLENKKVWIHHSTKRPDAIKKLGRIHALVFHPNKPQVVGFLVKRPDIAWMFRREDAFVAFNGFKIMEDDGGKEVIVVKNEPSATGRGALKALGVKLDDCLLWLGMSVICEDKTALGVIGSVDFDEVTGEVREVIISQGATANALLGKRKVSASAIKGFKMGEGAKLNMPESFDEEAPRGAIVVSNEVADLPVLGGAAEKAGSASAVAIDKVQKTYTKVKDKASPTISEAASTAGKAVQKGAYVTGRQVARTKGMFKGFTDEFKKAMDKDD